MGFVRLALTLTGSVLCGPSLALDGKAVYLQTCAACHTSGTYGAPKLGDWQAWQPRLGAGMQGLLQAVLRGKGAMPPKGGNANLTDTDVQAAVQYMIGVAR